MNILEELKLSKRQNNNKRYDYLCKQFNVVDYAIKLEKYTIKLQQENKILKENAENNDKVVDKVNWENMLLKKENEQLKDNRNKLKEWLVQLQKFKGINQQGFSWGVAQEVLDKMEEIEKNI